MYKFLCENKFSFLWDVCLRAHLLVYLTHPFFTWKRNHQTLLQTSHTILHSPAMYESPGVLHLYLPFGTVSAIFDLAILIGMKQLLIGV